MKKTLRKRERRRKLEICFYYNFEPEKWSDIKLMSVGMNAILAVDGKN